MTTPTPTRPTSCTHDFDDAGVCRACGRGGKAAQHVFVPALCQITRDAYDDCCVACSYPRTDGRHAAQKG